MASRILAGRYELLDKIGEGGMAVVFKSRDRLLNRYVAIKILRPEFTKDAVFIESFRRESQMAAGLTHPNIVNIYDVGKEGNIYYIVMELMDGRALSDIIKEEGPLEPRLAANITRQIASALSAAHKNKLIHRDVKPHNIMFALDGTAKITDFGIAKKVTGETLVSDQKENVMGSVHYFSPEQARGGYVDEKSDIYSLGICLYEMLTGKVPFDGETAVEVAVKHINEAMVPPRKINPNIPSDLDDIVMKATDKKPENRYRSCDEMITALNFVSYAKKKEAKPEEPVEENKPISVKEELIPKAPEHVSDDYLIKREAKVAAGEIAANEADEALPRRSSKNSEEKRESMASNREERRSELRASVERHVKLTDTEERDENEPKKFFLRPQRYIAVVLAIALAIPASSLVYGIFTKDPEKATTKVEETVDQSEDQSSTKVVEVTVPTLVGKNVEDAGNELTALGLKLEVELELVSKDVPEGQVMSQTPSAGSTVKTNQTVRVNVSKGSVSGTVPNITGKSVNSAKTVLTSYEYQLNIASYQESTEIAEGYIISQNPSAGTTLASGGKINVVVSSGSPETPEFDIVGKTFAEARSIIQDAGYSIGLNTQQPSDEIEYGCIIKYIVNGTKVDLYVSSGVKQAQQTTEVTEADGFITYELDYSSYVDDIEDAAFTANISVVDDMGARTLYEECVTDAGKASFTIEGSGTDGSITIICVDLGMAVQLYHVNFTEHTYSVTAN